MLGSRLLPVLLGLLLWAAFASAGEVYRWVDAQGRVHFSDRPARSDARQVTVGPGQSPDADAQRRRQRRDKLLRAYEEERRLREEAREQARLRRKEREQRCAQARSRLRAYRYSRALYERGESGERRYLSEAERSEAISAAREAVEHWCG